MITDDLKIEFDPEEATVEAFQRRMAARYAVIDELEAESQIKEEKMRRHFGGGYEGSPYSRNHATGELRRIDR
jgi:hypothetical protein